jgi:alcohol dehydrogenase class IV
MKTIWRELPIAYREPTERRARKAMMLAATQAGIAFSNASVALVHGMSRPLGVQFHIPHGLSNAMLLPTVTAFSVSAARERYAICARTMGVAPEGAGEDEAVAALIRGLFGRNAELGVPSPRQFGIARESYEAAIPTMTAQALASGSPHNNPRIPTADEIGEIYREAWE